MLTQIASDIKNAKSFSQFFPAAFGADNFIFLRNRRKNIKMMLTIFTRKLISRHKSVYPFFNLQIDTSWVSTSSKALLKIKRNESQKDPLSILSQLLLPEAMA